MKTFLYIITNLLFNIIYIPFYVLVWAVTVPFDKKRRLLCGIVSQIYGNSLIYSSPWWKVKINGLENIDKNKTYVLMINHQSMYDIPFVSGLPINMRWISKKAVFKAPIIGLVLFLRGDITIVRGALADSKKMLKDCRKQLKNGVSISIFPEGTRSKSGRVMPFKEGGFVVAKMSTADILPIVVEGTRDALRPLKGKGLRFPNTFTMDILKPIPNEEFRDMQVKELKQHVHEIIYNHHKTIRPDLYE